MTPTYAIVVGWNAASTEKIAAEDLADSIRQRVGQRPRVFRGVNDLSAIAAEAVFAIGTAASNPIVARQAQQIEARLGSAGSGDQGYVVQSAQLDGKAVVVLAGATALGAMYAVYAYLERECGAGFFNDGNRLPQLSQLPIAGLDYAEAPHFKYRVWFHHAVWTRPYDQSFRLWGLEDWKKLIDWMRRKRLNVINLFHDEGTYLWGDAIFRAFPEIPKNSHTLKHFVMAPEYRTELNRQVFRYARDSGVSVAYNLFYSQVPDFFAQYFPDLQYHQLLMGNLGICAIQPECAQIMRRFWEEILDLYGTDDAHLYAVCGYQHEVPLCANFTTRAEPTRQAYEVLKALDPQIRFFAENWCWYYGHKHGKDPDQSLAEWQAYQDLLPVDAGVYDWDRVARPWRPTMRPPGAAFNWYKPREWISLHHLGMEMSSPPDHGWHPISDTMRCIDVGAQNEAAGLASFHIQARTNELPSHVFAERAWNPDQSQDSLVQAYLQRRFRPESLAALTSSFAAYFEAVTPDARMFGAHAGNCWPAETALVEKVRELGHAASDAWRREQLDDFRYRYAQTQAAAARAQTVESLERGNAFYDGYLWQLQYLLNRWEGLIEFFEAYATRLETQTQCAAAGEHFTHALAAFCRIRSMYQHVPGIRMDTLQQRAPEVRYNPSFLDNWRVTIWREAEPIRHHDVVWELFPEYEAALQALNPALLSPGPR